MLDLLNRWLLGVAAVALVAAFGCVLAGVIGRPLGWAVPGLDAYAGYAIAAAMFLALPETLKRDRHIRVLLLAHRLPAPGRRRLELGCVLAGAALAGALAWYAARLVWVSRAMHDVSSAADATPLWLPQLAMALGSAGLAAAFVQAAWRLLHGHGYFAPAAGGEHGE